MNRNPPRKTISLCIGLSLAGALVPGLLMAEAELPPREMLVTANRFAQFSSDLLNAHSVLDRTRIERSGAGNLFDLLQTVPGVQLARTGISGAQTSLFLRGSNSNHTLILLDGVRLNTASEGAARLENLPLSHIERIEIIRGPQSSLYGADAIGGVIQIFTRSAVQNPDENSGAVSGRLEAGLGTEQSGTLHGSLRARWQATQIDVAVSHRETEGIPARNAPVPDTRNAAWDSQALSLGVQHALNEDWQVWGRWLATEATKLFETGDSESSQRTGSLGVRGQLSERWQSQLQFSRFKDDNLTREWGQARSTTRRSSVQWQNEWQLSERSHTAFGLDSDEEELLYLNPGAVLNASTRRNDAVFAVHQQALGRGLTLTASGRVDDNEQFGSHRSGRLALGADLGAETGAETGQTGNTQLWLAVSSAFKAPTLVDLFVDFPAFDFYANPQLRPERARTLEAGLRSELLGVSLDLSVFRNDIRDLIGSNAGFNSLTNTSRARIEGLELALSRDILGWHSELALTLLEHKNRDNGEALLRRPDQQMNLSASRRFGQLSLLLDWQLRSAQADLDPVSFGRSRVAGYGVLDAVVGWQPAPALDLQLKLGNMLDKRYEVTDGYNTLGRHAMLSARRQF